MTKLLEAVADLEEDLASLHALRSEWIALRIEHDALSARVREHISNPASWSGLSPADTTDRIQAMLDVGRCNLPARTFQIDRPLRTQYNQFDGWMRGYNDFGSDDCTTRLEYVGPPGEPMLIVESAMGLIDGIVFDCNSRATAGIHYQKHANGAGHYSPGKSRVPFARVEKATVAAIICGQEPHDEHCDNTTWGFLSVEKCPLVMLAHNGQSMGHDFSFVHAYETSKGWEFRGGGILDVGFTKFLHPGTLLTINEQRGPSNKATIGTGDFRYRFGMVKADSQAGGLCLLEKKGITNCRVSFDRGIIPQGSAKLIDVEGRVVVRIRDFGKINKNSIIAVPDRKGKANIRLSDCEMAYGITDPSETLAANSEAYFSADGCYNEQCEPVES